MCEWLPFFLPWNPVPGCQDTGDTVVCDCDPDTGGQREEEWNAQGSKSEASPGYTRPKLNKWTDKYINQTDRQTKRNTLNFYPDTVQGGTHS